METRAAGCEPVVDPGSSMSPRQALRAGKRPHASERTDRPALRANL